ncbi:hypothetical protein APHCRT_0151 [Anaplasma phagocytophilum str. CRT53-1]|uniref:Uncharacterized protein n=1 Tax=Anaplasma phagocytophilum str. CRT53-1 TaxID=1359157 RepID=A0A0F3Q6X1_ANAPH|nr:hypothetical protein APHCRT_0151 [Anaplasma phagocytophilum str. CRT53-1]
MELVQGWVNTFTLQHLISKIFGAIIRHLVDTRISYLGYHFRIRVMNYVVEKLVCAFF